MQAKSLAAKEEKEKNNVEARPVTEDPKAPRYTEYYHNDELFHATFAKTHPQAVLMRHWLSS